MVINGSSRSAQALRSAQHTRKSTWIGFNTYSCPKELQQTFVRFTGSFMQSGINLVQLTNDCVACTNIRGANTDGRGACMVDRARAVFM